MPPPYPLPEILGVVRASVTGVTSRGSKWANILHFRYGTVPAVPTDAQLDTLDTKLKQLYTGTYAPGGTRISEHCHNATSFAQAAYTRLDALSPTYIKSWGLFGNDATEMGPPASSVCVSLYTAKRGKRYRGRCYLPPFSEGQVTAGQLAAAAQTGQIAQWNNFLVDIPGSQWWLVVATYGHSIDKHGVEHTWTPEANNVSRIAINQKLDTQRRRRA